jgi:RNA:NAD 2'-phosphotransferase (TPT1/KptA family)
MADNTELTQDHKAALTRKRRAAGKKAAVTKKRRETVLKAVATRHKPDQVIFDIAVEGYRDAARVCQLINKNPNLKTSRKAECLENARGAMQKFGEIRELLLGGLSIKTYLAREAT